MSDKSLMMMPWFPRDFMSATRGWSVTAKGVYRELLDAQWDMGELPVEPDDMKSVIGATDAEWAAAWPKVESKFPLNCSGRKNHKLEAHRLKAQSLSSKRAELGSRGGKARAQAIAKAIATPIAQAELKHPSPSPSPSIRTKNKRTLPKDFDLDEELKAYAADKLPSVDLGQLLASFKNKAAAGGWSYVDWRRAFQEYVRNCAPGSGHWAAGQYPKSTTGFEGMKWT